MICLFVCSCWMNFESNLLAVTSLFHGGDPVKQQKKRGFKQCGLGLPAASFGLGAHQNMHLMKHKMLSHHIEQITSTINKCECRVVFV